MTRKILKNKTLLYSFLIALPLAIVFGVLLPVNHSGYKVTIDSTENTNIYQSKFYNDWNNDGISEFVLLVENNLGDAAVKCYNSKGQPLGQFNLKSRFTRDLPQAYFNDYDRDGHDEMFFLTQTNDSLLLNGFDFVDERFFIYQQLIDTAPLVNGKNDFSCNISGFMDANSDGLKEIFIFINAGFSLQPRNFYRFDVKNREVIKSPETYTKSNVSAFFDLDGDGMDEILCINQTTSNCSDSLNVPFPDTLGWGFVFDADLKFKFPPKSFYGNYSNVKLLPVKLINQYGLVCLFSNKGEDGDESRIVLLDSEGNILKQRILSRAVNNLHHRIIAIGNSYEKFLLILSNGETFELDNELGLKRKFIDSQLFEAAYFMTVNFEPNDYLYILVNRELSKIAVSTPDLKHIKEIDTDKLSAFLNVSLKKNEKSNQIFIHDSQKGYTVSFSRNRYFLLGFLIYPLEYLLFVVFIFHILNVQRKRIVRQYETEKRLNELQFQNIKNQLTPHFTFNVLNSIGKMVKSGESEEAYNYLSKNSKMIRILMDESNKITRSLKQEISFVEDYLALQKIRFKERYDFAIEIKGEVNLNVEIPKMIIHTYVENAIKHGLSKIRENGKLEIEISQSSKRKYTFVVSDNGSGIDPVQVEQNKGRGLKLMDEYFRLFEDYYDYKISTSIGQKNPERPGQPGTIVQISLELPPEYF